MNRFMVEVEEHIEGIEIFFGVLCVLNQVIGVQLEPIVLQSNNKVANEYIMFF